MDEATTRAVQAAFGAASGDPDDDVSYEWRWCGGAVEARLVDEDNRPVTGWRTVSTAGR